MIPQPEGRPRAALHDLARRARAAAVEWTDAGDHDPGVALLELLATVADQLSAFADRVADEAYLGSRHPGHAVAGAAACGIHRGLVVEAVDPLMEHRLLVRVPSVLGDGTAWALACLPLAGSGAPPEAGSVVWVAFEDGDPSRPVWLGRPGPG